jgi:hypothetical protein
MTRKAKVSEKSDIVNFYEIIPKKYINKVENNNYHLHNIELPFRMCIVAPSGSGKTNFLLNLIKIMSVNKGTFADIFVITANKDEPLYNYLEGEIDGIYIKEGLSNLPNLDDFDKEYNHLVVLDDMITQKNLKPICDYFIRARKQNVSVVFLSQSYYAIPKVIRLNSNYLVLLHLGGAKRERTAILNEWNQDLDFDKLNKLFNDATSEHMRPLIITGGKIEKNKKYRKGWLDYYDLDRFFS